MPFDPQQPLIYLITKGETSLSTTSESRDFQDVLRVVETAVTAEIDLVQIREKNLNGRVLYALATRAVQIARGSSTRILVNDRADIAAMAEADGVHLTTRSLPPAVVRHTFGGELLIGASTHSLEEAALAKSGGANFVVFGPIFETASKLQYGNPQGLEKLRQVSVQLGTLPVLAIGGVTIEKVAECARAGARGVAAIQMFDVSRQLSGVADQIRADFLQAASTYSRS